MNKLRIAGAALNQTPFDWDNNAKNIIEAIREARANHVDILCLPELCITGYGCEDQFLSDWLWRKAKGFLPTIIPECTGLLVAVGLPLQYDRKLYNCSCYITDQKIIAIRAKQFLANDGVHYEPRWFTPWTFGEIVQYKIENVPIPFGDVIVDYKGIKIGMEICEDAWRGSERPACKFGERGVGLIINPSASHFAFEKTKIREQLAIDASGRYNLVYVYANLLGNESGRMIFDGEIFVSGLGKVYNINERFSFRNVNLLIEDIDFDDLGTIPVKEIAPEDKNRVFTQAVTLALFDYLRKSRSKGFVISLSGGADSSTCAILVAEMIKRGIEELGATDFLRKANREDLIEEIKKVESHSAVRFITSKMLICAYQGTRNSSKETLQSAKMLAEECGAVFHHWLIDDEVSSYTAKIEKAINRELNWDHDDIALQNIQARARSPIIWMLANIYNSLLITTSNRSEGDVGYATMDGDTSGSIAPIAGVDKHFINNYLKWAERELGYKSLHHVNSLQPSAELRPLEKSQTDEKDLMPYSLIVEIEKLAIRDRLHPKEVFERLKNNNDIQTEVLKSYIKKFYTLWSRNQWKRERIAPSFHLDDMNVDPRTWCRFPILSGSFLSELEELED